MLLIPFVLSRLCVEQNRVRDGTVVAPDVSVRRGAFPHDLREKAIRTEHGIKRELEVVTRRRIAVKVERTRRFECAMQLDEPRQHHHEVREQRRVGRDHASECLRQIRYTISAIALDEPAVVLFGFFVPLPRIAERLDLRAGLPAERRAMDQVVLSIRVERRVEVHEVHRLVRDVPAKDVEVVAVVQGAHVHAGSRARAWVRHFLQGDSHRADPDEGCVL